MWQRGAAGGALMLAAALVVLGQAPPSKPVYRHGPDSEMQPGVPEGKVIKQAPWTSKVFPDTVRDWWIYVPAQYKATEPACVMVFQDGEWYQNRKGDFRVPTVFDNLIHQGKMPVTIGVFLNPGVVPAPKAGGKPRPNRSFEYDTLSDQYATFLEKEILPEVAKSYKLRNTPESRAVAGISSGGICAWTVAWERPDLFRKVLSHVGSFTNIRGGDVYPGLIRKTEKKPIRAYLQAGRRDLDNLHGSWPLANLQMEAALRFKGYDFRFVMGEEGHNGKHGGVLMPESLKWLWEKEAPGKGE
ncbi:MAG: alpha/beta hydrolase-fold protein [Gemmataceae bacterium]